MPQGDHGGRLGTLSHQPTHSPLVANVAVICNDLTYKHKRNMNKHWHNMQCNSQHFGELKNSLLTEVSTIRRIFYTHGNLPGPTKAVCYREPFPVRGSCYTRFHFTYYHTNYAYSEKLYIHTYEHEPQVILNYRTSADYSELQIIYVCTYVWLYMAKLFSVHCSLL